MNTLRILTLATLTVFCCHASLCAQQAEESRGSEVQEQELSDFEAKVLKTIRTQLKSRRLVKARKNEYRRESDSYVIAKIDVEAESQVANVCFETFEGLEATAEKIFDYLKETPTGAMRDFRIVSRHRDFENADEHLAVVRKQYDEFKEQEKQMLAYLQARNQAFARVQQTRRC